MPDPRARSHADLRGAGSRAGKVWEWSVEKPSTVWDVGVALAGDAAGPRTTCKRASARAFSRGCHGWHAKCLVCVQPRTRREDTSMRSIKHDLEEQRSALKRSIKTVGTIRDLDQGREIVKDPYGAASMTHD